MKTGKYDSGLHLPSVRPAYFDGSADDRMVAQYSLEQSDSLQRYQDMDERQELERQDILNHYGSVSTQYTAMVERHAAEITHVLHFFREARSKQRILEESFLEHCLCSLGVKSLLVSGMYVDGPNNIWPKVLSG